MTSNERKWWRLAGIGWVTFMVAYLGIELVQRVFA